VQDDDFDPENKIRQRERWQRAITISTIAIIGSGILTFASQDIFFPPPIRTRSIGVACIANLKCIDGAKATWALENQITNNAAPLDSELFGANAYIREKPTCPAGGVYIIGAVSQKPRCSIPGHTI
jgi:hypothetical protein